MTARIIMKMSVAAIEPLTDTVNIYTFRHPRRPLLPAPTPGAHVDLHLAQGRIRQYSLCGDPADDSCYQIAVKREDTGRGGSRWLHEQVRVGDVVPVSAPRNNFPLAAKAARHVFIAGGIGITPMLSMITQLDRDGVPFELHFCAHSQNSAPFLTRLQQLCGQERLFTYFPDAPGKTGGRLNAAVLLGRLIPGTHIYCCGPQRLTQGVHEACAHWPAEQTHFELFKATLDENFKPEPFDMKIASSGQVIRVPADKSALEVLRAHGIGLPSSCELGVCGSCACRYTEGIIIHRDSVLDINARQDYMMPCVSRARSNVTLDL